MKLRYTPAALCDMDEINAYIRDTLLNPDAARRTIASIINTCARLKEQPDMGVELRQKTGREIKGRGLISGKYLIIYEADEAVSILRVLDTRMDVVRILFG